MTELSRLRPAVCRCSSRRTSNCEHGHCQMPEALWYIFAISRVYRMLRAASAVVLAVLSTWIFSEPAFAEKRVALVIGNSAYQKVPPLANPARDAAAMSEMFKSAGFDVVRSRHDLGIGDMRRTL